MVLSKSECCLELVCCGILVIVEKQELCSFLIEKRINHQACEFKLLSAQQGQILMIDGSMFISFWVLSTAFTELLPNYSGRLVQQLGATASPFHLGGVLMSLESLVADLQLRKALHLPGLQTSLGHSIGEIDAAVISHQVKDYPSKFHLLLPLQPGLARVYRS